MQADLSWMVGLIAMMAGMAARWFLSSLRRKARINEVIGGAHATKNIELATLRERLRTGEEQAHAAAERVGQAEAESRRLGSQLDA